MTPAHIFAPASHADGGKAEKSSLSRNFELRANEKSEDSQSEPIKTAAGLW